MDESRSVSDDMQRFEVMRKHLNTPVLGDILDQMGYYHQFLDPSIRPLRVDMVLVGRAMPVLMMDVFEPQEKPFGLMPEALDDLKTGEVYIASGAQFRSANFGELMAAASRMRGAVGAVVNGYHRDTPKVLEQNFPLFSRGCFAQDSGPRMKVADFRVTIEIGDIKICPGDLVFADIDGVLIVPGEVEKEAVARALEKARTEKAVRTRIEKGEMVSDLFKEYGVL